MYILYFLFSAAAIAVLCFSLGGLSNGSMITYGILIWLLAVLFDQIFPKIFGLSVSAPKGRVDFVYYTLSIAGIVLLFQAQETQRKKDELGYREALEQDHRDLATAEMSAIEKEINNVGALPGLIRSAAAEEVKNSEFIKGQACACANQLPESGCESPLQSSNRMSDDKLTLELRRSQAAAACETLMNDKSIDAIKEVSQEQNPAKLQTLIETHADELKLWFGRKTITGRQAVRLLNEPDYRRRYIETEIAPAKARLEDATLALNAIKREREATNFDANNSHGFLIYAMEAYWPAFLLMGVGLKLSQSGLSMVKTS